MGPLPPLWSGGRALRRLSKLEYFTHWYDHICRTTRCEASLETKEFRAAAKAAQSRLAHQLAPAATREPAPRQSYPGGKAPAGPNRAKAHAPATAPLFAKWT